MRDFVGIDLKLENWDIVFDEEERLLFIVISGRDGIIYDVMLILNYVFCKSKFVMCGLMEVEIEVDFGEWCFNEFGYK